MTTSDENAPEGLLPAIEPTRVATTRERRRLGHPRILLAEDNSQMCLLLAMYLEDAGYDVVPCRDGLELAEHLGSYLLAERDEFFDLIISDIRMPHVTGLEILASLHGRQDFPRMILITAFGDPETHARARRLGALAVFDKPFPILDLVAKVRELLPVDPDPWAARSRAPGEAFRPERGAMPRSPE